MMRLASVRLQGTLQLPGEKSGRDRLRADERLGLAMTDAGVVVVSLEGVPWRALPPWRVLEADIAPNRQQRRAAKR